MHQVRTIELKDQRRKHGNDGSQQSPQRPKTAQFLSFAFRAQHLSATRKTTRLAWSKFGTAVAAALKSAWLGNIASGHGQI
jgi:hypothetical protein